MVNAVNQYAEYSASFKCSIDLSTFNVYNIVEIFALMGIVISIMKRFCNLYEVLRAERNGRRY